MRPSARVRDTVGPLALSCAAHRLLRGRARVPRRFRTTHGVVCGPADLGCREARNEISTRPAPRGPAHSYCFSRLDFAQMLDEGTVAAAELFKKRMQLLTLCSRPRDYDSKHLPSIRREKRFESPSLHVSHRRRNHRRCPNGVEQATCNTTVTCHHRCQVNVCPKFLDKPVTAIYFTVQA